MNQPTIRVLLVEDDEDDQIILLARLCDLRSHKIEVDWVCTYPEAMVEIARNRHDLHLVDYRLGPDNGIDLIREARERGSAVPAILLTRYCDRFLEKKAREAGAADFLPKNQADAATLERVILGVLERAPSRE
jgi:two-component system, cell cycle sensor histidine kinase and response regulator CckA